MTREEQINCASKDYINYLLDKQEYHNENYTENDIRKAFEKGVVFADNNPNLSALWHNITKKPESNTNIIIIDKENNWFDVEYEPEDFDGGWNTCVKHYNAKMWAYKEKLAT